jgi:polyhydroxybutyrate depolymerase
MFFEKMRKGNAGARSENSASQIPAGLIAGTIDSHGITRRYLVHLPPGHNNGALLPLILAFHGGTGTAEGMPRMCRLNPTADLRGYIVVYPEGIHKHWQDGRIYREGSSVDDVAFIADLIAKLSREYPIDQRRIYATGISAGGFFSQRLACEMPDKIAAAAPVVATRVKNLTWSPRAPIPMMFVLGTNDPLVRWNGGVLKGTALVPAETCSADETLRFWINEDHCYSDPVILRDVRPGDGTHLIAKSYKANQGTEEVVFCKVEGGGHCWPGGPQYLPQSFVGKATAAPINDLLCDFFDRHHL